MDIKSFVQKARTVGAFVVVDGTLAPAPLQFVMDHGPDMLMASSTKFYGGHCDLLGGILVARNIETAEILKIQRRTLGNVMGSLESWLLLRSLRSFHVRIMKQSENAEIIVSWLNSNTDKVHFSCVLEKYRYNFSDFPSNIEKGIIKQIHHGSISVNSVSGQMLGHSPVFAMEVEILLSNPS
jgi:cystathionine beta-lyase/cystathionine gamma-synthase